MIPPTRAPAPMPIGPPIEPAAAPRARAGDEGVAALGARRFLVGFGAFGLERRDLLVERRFPPLEAVERLEGRVLTPHLLELGLKRAASLGGAGSAMTRPLARSTSSSTSRAVMVPVLRS